MLTQTSSDCCPWQVAALAWAAAQALAVSPAYVANPVYLMPPGELEKMMEMMKRGRQVRDGQRGEMEGSWALLGDILECHRARSHRSPLSGYLVAMQFTVISSPS
ncbi:MAG: hypothetical protein ACM3N4_12670 [Nitrososphaerota archaeon]